MSGSEQGGDNVVELGGAELHYRVSGDEGPTIVVLHGAGGILTNGDVAAGLSPWFQVYEPSLPGCDESPPSEAVATLFDQADLIADFITEIVGGPTILVGHSYGGRVASWVAIRHPDLVGRLVLSAPATLESKPGGPPPAERGTYEPPRAVFGDREVPFGREELERIGRGARHMFGYMPSSPDRPTALDALATISSPTLLLWAEKDEVLSQENGPEVFAAAIPDARVHVFDDAPHLLTLFYGVEFVDQVRSFATGG
jgi:pimeloyl-ACP methyl ester carboxylesterase